MDEGCRTCHPRGWAWPRCANVPPSWAARASSPTRPAAESAYTRSCRWEQVYMDRVRILLADDHPLFREGLAAVLATRPNLELVSQAATGPEAVAQALALLPDIVLMDIQMPGLSGIEATRRI